MLLKVKRLGKFTAWVPGAKGSAKVDALLLCRKATQQLIARHLQQAHDVVVLRLKCD